MLSQSWGYLLFLTFGFLWRLLLKSCWALVLWYFKIQTHFCSCVVLWHIELRLLFWFYFSASPAFPCCVPSISFMCLCPSPRLFSVQMSSVFWYFPLLLCRIICGVCGVSFYFSFVVLTIFTYCWCLHSVFQVNIALWFFISLSDCLLFILDFPFSALFYFVCLCVLDLGLVSTTNLDKIDQHDHLTWSSYIVKPCFKAPQC